MTKRSKAIRAVVVVDRGWIFAGNVHDEGDFIRLKDAIHVFSWREIGFAAMIESPGDKRVDLRPMANNVEIPKGSVIFQVPVIDTWGKK